jgi:hypothetical protein
MRPLQSDVVRLPVKGLILAGICLGALIAAAAVGLRVYRGDREYRILLGSLAGSVLLYAGLFAVLPPNLGILPRGGVEPDPAVDFWNGVLILVLVFHGIWAFTYMVWTGPTVRVLLAASRAGRAGLTMDEVLRQFETSDRANQLLRRRLPKLTRGGYLREERGRYVLLPRGRAAGRIVTRVKQAIGDLERA